MGGSQFVVQQGSGNVGIATANPNYKLDVNGSVNVSSQLRIPATVVGGSAVCLNGYLGLCSSDARLKHDIRYLEDGALEKVISLKPATYIFNTDMSSTTRAGFIAQDTLPFIPEAAEPTSTDLYMGYDRGRFLRSKGDPGAKSSNSKTLRRPRLKARGTPPCSSPASSLRSKKSSSRGLLMRRTGSEISSQR